MDSEKQAEQLNAIVDELLDRKGSPQFTTILGRLGPPFDVAKPNIHDSKREF